MPRSTRCIVHVHDYVTTHHEHHLQPQSRGGWTSPDNMVWLCANGHGDVHFFLDLIEDAADRLRKSGMLALQPADAVTEVPWAVAQHFSPAIRATAVRGWNRYAAAYLSGDYDRHRAIWSTSGQPREGMPRGIPPYSVAASRSEASVLLAAVAAPVDTAEALRALLSRL